MHITQELLQAALAPVTEAVVQHAFDSGGTEARLSASADSVVILSIEAPSTEDGLEWCDHLLQLPLPQGATRPSARHKALSI
eukprot:SAG11_NODE_243_length_11749_cov_33.422918_3_plen_82_part_00